MKKIYNFIKKTRKAILQRKKRFPKKVRVVKSIAIIVGVNEKKIVNFKRALDLLKEDFVFAYYNDLNSINREYDFIIYAGVDTVKKYKPNKLKSLHGLLLLNDEVSIAELKGHSLDIILCKSFYQISKLKDFYRVVHAYGIDYNDSQDDNTLIDSDNILKLRYLGISQIKINKNTLEFINSPFWDLKYFSEQLRKVFLLFNPDQTRSITPILSNKFLKVGRHSFHNGYEINGNVYVNIGSFCSIGKNVSIYTVNHDTRFATTQGYLYRRYFKKPHPAEAEKKYSKSRSKGPITIKNDVIIYEGAKIMSGVTIGNGACIGAGSIVTNNVEDYEIVAGIPAKHVGYRFSKKIREQLLALSWWDWSDTKIANNEEFFNLNFNELDNINDVEIK